MGDRSKHIDQKAVEGQENDLNDEHDPGAIPAPHSLPLSEEFEDVLEDQGDTAERTPDLADSVGDQGTDDTWLGIGNVRTVFR